MIISPYVPYVSCCHISPCLYMGMNQNWVPQKMDFFPPLTLMPCDSGRDNQLRVKSPPMIVIIN